MDYGVYRKRADEQKLLMFTIFIYQKDRGTFNKIDLRV